MSKVDITPTWRTAIEICILVLEAGTERGKELAKQELREMGDHLDGAFPGNAPDVQDRLRTRPNHWKEQPGHPVEDWQAEVAARDTALGYSDWCDVRRTYAHHTSGRKLSEGGNQ